MPRKSTHSEQQLVASALDRAAGRRDRTLEFGCDDNGVSLYPHDRAEKGKIPYSGRVSRHFAAVVAQLLRAMDPKRLTDLQPREDDTGHESGSGIGADKVKRLDVAVRSPLRGTELSVTIKTINFPDGASGRWTKNMERSARELGDEAALIHSYMPGCVLVGLVLVRSDALDDGHPRLWGPANVSSFAHGVHVYRYRSGRRLPTDPAGLLEGIYLGWYLDGVSRTDDGTITAVDDSVRGYTRWFDVMNNPPAKRWPRPWETLSLTEVLGRIIERYDERWTRPRTYAPDTPLRPDDWNGDDWYPGVPRRPEPSRPPKG